MRIGLSLSRCVRDIVQGRVKIEDVLVIIARTRVDLTKDEDWQELWEGYNGKLGFSQPEWLGLDHDEVKATVLKLWNWGLIHQPRNFGNHPSRRPEVWLETIWVGEDLEQNVAVKDAWDKFKMLANLTAMEFDEHYR